MLVSMAVLSLIMILVGQLINSAAISTILSGKQIGTDSQARMLFDRMAIDFSRMPPNTDVDFIFSKQTGSDKMFFYSEAPGYYDTSSGAGLYLSATVPDPKSSMALIGYMVNTGSNNTGGGIVPPPYCLQRLGKGLIWDSQAAGSGLGGLAFLTFATPGATTPLPQSALAGTSSYTASAVGVPPTYSGTDSCFDVVADEVFRMEFCFQVKDLSNSAAPGSAYSNYPVAYFKSGSTNQSTESTAAPATANVGDRWYDQGYNRAFVCTSVTGTSSAWTPNGMADVSAIVVAIATLDSTTRKLATPAQLGSLANALADPADSDLSQNPPKLMAQTWQAAVTSSSFASSANVPASIAAQVRVYQRFFNLNHN
jgi:hypothetical protein